MPYQVILFILFILFATLITKNIGKEEEEEKKRSGQSSENRSMKLTWFVEVFTLFDNDDMKTSFFFIIDFCFKMYFKIDSYKI